MEARDIILPAAALTVAATAAVTPTSAYDAKLNHPEAWGANCRKIDMPGNVMTYTPSGDNIRQVIVKGGTTNKVYTAAPFTDLSAEINPKSGKPYAISHIIICEDDEQSAPGASDTTKSDKTNKKTPAKSQKSTKPASSTGVGVLDQTTEAPESVEPRVETSSTATDTPRSGKGVVVKGTSTETPVEVNHLPSTGAAKAGATILAAGAATYAGARVLRKR